MIKPYSWLSVLRLVCRGRPRSPPSNSPASQSSRSLVTADSFPSARNARSPLRKPQLEDRSGRGDWACHLAPFRPLSVVQGLSCHCGTGPLEPRSMQNSPCCPWSRDWDRERSSNTSCTILCGARPEMIRAGYDVSGAEMLSRCRTSAG
jgi:hypothetical protein